MLDSVEQITQRLIERYNPERILLYGSRARQEHRSDSDVDLFIIKDTNDPPILRRMAVEKLLQDRRLALDVEVYTPAETQKLYAAGSPFIEEVMQTGKVLYMRPTSQPWYDDACDELTSAEILLEHQAFKGACYHAQQCAEKALKTLLLEKGQQPPRIHDLLRLKNDAEALGYSLELSVDDAVFLSSVCKGRYPTELGLLPHGSPSAEDARRAVDAARAVLASVGREVG